MPFELVERVDVSLAARDEHVFVCTATDHPTPVFTHGHRHFTEGVEPCRHRLDLIFFQHALGLGELADALKDRINGPHSESRALRTRAVELQLDRRTRLAERAARNRQLAKFEAIVFGFDHVGHNGLDVFVKDGLLRVGESLEANEGFFEFFAFDLQTEFIEAFSEGVASGMFSKD